MPRYMLDTNMCIYLMKHQPEQVARHFDKCFVGDVIMSAITFAELEYGVKAAENPEREGRNLKALVDDIPVAPFDSAAGSAYGAVRLATRDIKIDHLDKLIAAHALSLKVTLVTNNEQDFKKYPGLKTENWVNE